ncbi:hypothetical protein N7E81_07655 [Reichenbachiella carrageenanivorans]|uniref:Uncharacterized protein n=1 Tax=Reichenbachiella carrageenanivorans TaxID=2979869 RepID=A0ABY6D488_9BACT|nr:hypothetical protein [Reichenbachiella carrageenanivorans]UXX80972.1 hypothetical protein N7E81_07655 [Reichenbachiella carrageenanivorans]
MKNRTVLIVKGLFLVCLLASAWSLRSQPSWGQLKPNVQFEYRKQQDKKKLDLTWEKSVSVLTIKIMSIVGDDLGVIEWDGKPTRKMALDVTDLPNVPPMYTFVMKNGQEWSYTFKSNRKK